MKLIDKELSEQEKIIKEIKNRKIAVFTAGPTAVMFERELHQILGVKAEFFIDNNPKLEDKIINGKPVMLHPWKSIDNFSNEYVVIAASSTEFCRQIAQQLSDVCTVPYISHYHLKFFGLLKRIKTAVTMFEDELSKISYLASIYQLLTCDNEFIHHCDSQYFYIKEFMYNFDEVIIDAGAYVGDTVEEYIRRGYGNKIYAFEPFDNVRSALEIRVERLKKEWAIDDNSVIIVPAGVGIETRIERFHDTGKNMLMLGNDGDVKHQIYSLDDYFKDKEPFTVLKADIEGGEFDMLKGAKLSIIKSKPKMAICIYHNPDDYCRIIEYIKEIVPEYHFCVRNHYSDFRDTVLYCWV